MALKRPARTLVVLGQASKILENNPLGDPHLRKVVVWSPRPCDGMWCPGFFYRASRGGMLYHLSSLLRNGDPRPGRNDSCDEVHLICNKSWNT